MQCKKCKKECLESELLNGICKECVTKIKYPTIKTIIISVIFSVLISLLIIGWANNDVALSDFNIDSFNMDTDTNSYGSYISYSYNGKGIISCTNTSTDYLVLIRQLNKATNETEFTYTVVHNGKGEFITYDSSYSGTTQKPEYEFEIIGYRSFKK